VLAILLTLLLSVAACLSATRLFPNTITIYRHDGGSVND